MTIAIRSAQQRDAYSSNRISSSQLNDSLLIHWRGEDVEGYSMQFRHVEFKSAVAAVLGTDSNDIEVRFENALNYTGTNLRSALKINGYNQAMQYLFLPNAISASVCIQAARRCSLVHAIYEIVAETGTTGSEDGSAKSYDELATIAFQNDAFSDMQVGERNANQTWSLRVRRYGVDGASEDGVESVLSSKDRRYGERTRSITLERQALTALTPVIRNIGGSVNLHKPDCKIYVFDGLLPRVLNHDGATEGEVPVTNLLLTRRLTSGARRKVSSIHPTTRICITNTPLCPISSFVMVNIARVKASERGCAILDPYCGSGGILLAAAMILQMPDVLCQNTPATPPRLVGIDISHDGIVNRDNIRKDFVSRHWDAPITLLQGDSTDSEVRGMARAAIDHQPFDAIVTDPPYGIRESNKGASQPIHDLLQMIRNDREAGMPLLRIGGRLVVFIPHRVEEETVDEIFPNEDLLLASGLICEFVKEQPLNDMLSRWLISYVCFR
jgi:Putative RNA methylase family UPF0020